MIQQAIYFTTSIIYFLMEERKFSSLYTYKIPSEFMADKSNLGPFGEFSEITANAYLAAKDAKENNLLLLDFANRLWDDESLNSTTLKKQTSLYLNLFKHMIIEHEELELSEFYKENIDLVIKRYLNREPKDDNETGKKLYENKLKKSDAWRYNKKRQESFNRAKDIEDDEKRAFHMVLESLFKMEDEGEIHEDLTSDILEHILEYFYREHNKKEIFESFYGGELSEEEMIYDKDMELLEKLYNDFEDKEKFIKIMEKIIDIKINSNRYLDYNSVVDLLKKEFK